MDDFSLEFDNLEAQTRVNAAKISESEKADYLVFINNFPELVFYANTDFAISELGLDNDIEYPESISEPSKILAGVLFGKSFEIQFSKFNDFSPRADRLPELWYSITLMGLPSAGRERQILLSSSAKYSLIPFASVQGDETASSYFLAVNAKKSDKKIYEFDILDLYDNYRDGIPIERSAYPVFSSYANMLASVAKIRYLDKKKKIILNSKP